MMKLLLAFLLLPISLYGQMGPHRKIFTPAGSGITFIAAAYGTSGSSPTTTATTLNVQVNDKLVAFCATGGSLNTLNVTDTSGDTFSKYTHQNDPAVGNSDMAYTVAATANATESFTCTQVGTSAGGSMVVLQYRGGATSSIGDVHDNNAGTASIWTSANFTTGAATEVVVQCLTSSQSGGDAAGTIGGVAANVRYTQGAVAYAPFCQDVIFSSIQTSINGSILIPSTGDFTGQLGGFK